METALHPDAPSAADSPAGSTLPALAVAVALGVALSPLLADLATHLRAEAWPRSWLIFPVLTVVAAHGSAGTGRPARDGLLWIATAAVLEIAALGSGLLRMGRPAIAMAALGWFRMTGRAAWPGALLALWWIPPPSFVVKAASPSLESALAAVAAAPFSAVTNDGVRLLAPAGTLTLAPEQGGLALAALLAGLGWYAAVRTRHGVAGCALWAGIAALAGLPLQTAAVLAASALLLAGAPGLAEALLTPGLALASVVVAVVVAEFLRARRLHAERSAA